METSQSSEHDGRAMKIVSKYNPRCADQESGINNKLMIFERDQSEIDEYLEAVDYIIHKFERTTLEAETVRKQLLDEFRSKLSHTFNTTGNSNTYLASNYCAETTCDSTSVSSVGLCFVDPDLHSIAQRLRAMGYLQDCKEIYKTNCLVLLNATLRRLGIGESISLVEVKRMEWESLDKIVGQWLKLVVFCINMIPDERHTCESIFEDHGDAFLIGIVRAYIAQFLDFARAIASCSHHYPQRLFRLLDLHHSSNLSLCVSFEEPRDDGLVTKTKKVLSQLTEAARKTFRKFEKAVPHDVSHITEVQEGVHSLTSYVVSYMIRLITEYGDECEWIVSKPRKVEVETRINGDIVKKYVMDGNAQSPFAFDVIWVIDKLLCSLESKIEQHQTDDAFAQFFMMNNINYIVRKLNEHPRLRRTIGHDIGWSLETALCSRKLDYLRSSWSKISQDLERRSSPKKIKLFGVSCFALSRTKETLRDFNATFEKVHQTQSKWLVCDPHLMHELHESILNILVPAYEHFLELLESSSSNTTIAIKYTVEDVKKAIYELFKGRPSTSFRSR